MKGFAFVACVAVAASVALPVFAGSVDFAVTVNGTRADLAFDAVPYARAIYLVWGAADAGRRTNGWDNVAACGTVAPDSASADVALPAGYDPATQYARFVLIDSYDSASYVTNGLVAHWDGIDNAGRGLHDAETTTWKDLAGTNDFTSADLSFTDTCGHLP